MRVLHVIEDAASAAVRAGGFRGRGLSDPVLGAARMVVARGRGHGVCLVGDERLERDARGLPVVGRIGRSPKWTWTTVAGLRRAAGAASTGAVVAWSAEALAAARRAFGAAPPLYGVMLEGPPWNDGALRAAVRAAPSRMVCGRAAARAWAEAGIAADRLVPAPPPVTTSTSDPSARAWLRRRLGVRDETPVVLVLGQAPHADAVRFVFLHGLLTLAGRRFIALMPSSVSQFDRGQRYFRSSSVGGDVVITPWGWPRLLAAADAAVFDGGGSGPTGANPPCPAAASLPIAASHAAGVPVAAPAWADTDGLYPAEARRCLAHNAVLPELARVLTPLVMDRGLARSLGEACRRHVARERPGDGFVAAVESMWAGLPAAPTAANDAVEVSA